MKLYTEEQMRDAIKMARNGARSEDNIIGSLNFIKPYIELPSDEEVEQYLKSFPYTKHLDDGQYNDGVIVGAELAIQWFRNKIQEGNNEQQ